MDISALLSPSDSPAPSPSTPAKETPPPAHLPTNFASPLPSPNRLNAVRPAAQKRKPSGLSHQVRHTSSPRVQEQYSGQAAHNAGYTSSQMPILSPGVASGSYLRRGGHSASVTPSSEPKTPLGPILERPVLYKHLSGRRQQSSTPGMDVLADAAVQSMSLDPPSAHLPRALYFSRALLPDESQQIADLLGKLQQSPHNYHAHVQLIGILRRGLYNTDENERSSYELLNFLRDARKTMAKVYLLGEELRADWIKDELPLAKDTSARVELMTLCEKAVQEAPASAMLWRLYGDYMYSLWGRSRDASDEAFSEDDQAIFTWEMMVKVWEDGVTATQWRLNDSNTIWDRYANLLCDDFESSPSQDKMDKITELFRQRLLKPHKTWDKTSEMYGSFLSNYKKESWEDEMQEITQRATQAKQQYALREVFELKLASATKAADKTAERTAFSEYLKWEVDNAGVFSFHLINALYERATTCFPIDAPMWEEYAGFVITNDNKAVSLTRLLERATGYCPWSGSLWSHRILALETEAQHNQSHNSDSMTSVFDELQAVKNDATRHGLLDEGATEERFLLCSAWCGFLRRWAFREGYGEDDPDIAESGIKETLEFVNLQGRKQFGEHYQGDPLFRLERIYIKFLTIAGRVEVAREIWTELVATHSHSYDFWYRFYMWEFFVWGKSNPVPASDSPIRASNILEQALTYLDVMDWPEQLIPMYLSHFEQHENVGALQKASVRAKKAELQVASRRAKEFAASAAATEAASAAASAAATEAATEAPVAVAESGPAVVKSVETEAIPGKRKRDGSPARDLKPEPTLKKGMHSSGKALAREHAELQDSQRPEGPQRYVRDREHSSVYVKNLPRGSIDRDVKQFFDSFGITREIAILPEQDFDTAIVEFLEPGSAEYAVKAAPEKLFQGNQISVERGTGCTLWCTNYPPESDEAYIRSLFTGVAEVVQYRPPNLEIKGSRRFCYVQVATRDQANSAVAQLNGKMLANKFKFVCKISDPRAGEKRVGAAYEGREIHLTHMSYEVNENDLRDLCARYGAVQSIRIMRNVNGVSKGTAYVAYWSKDSANTALAGLTGARLKGINMRVELAKPTEIRSQSKVVRPISPQPSNGEASSSTAPDNRALNRVALMDLSSTVTLQRIQKIAEETFGPLTQLNMRPREHGAVLEFKHKEDALKAFTKMHGMTIDGQKIRTGKVHELTQQRKGKEMSVTNAEPDEEPQAKEKNSGEGKETATGDDATAGGDGATNDGGEKKKPAPPPFMPSSLRKRAVLGGVPKRGRGSRSYR
ncbi:hypothetical protein K402DRAFT_390797 [Aulographum hederae CBS 113979]|uniref:RRM domain-containing protein n=1 Tax=Aulographum hederae CBS 113979 TaxID=1176131 RepID=A0A6G1H9B7_9PEZI|nr:hypothetical protein K402DRAFT_390797 [Aulographum hederae CBS 113979]